MRLLISDALKAVYQYIGTSKILDDPVAFEMSLLEHFDKTESNELTLKRFEEFRKKVESFPYQNEDYFYYIFRLEELKRNYFVRRTQDYDLSDMFSSLEGFYFLKKLKLICVRLSHNYIFKQEVDENFFLKSITA
jgi:hypothetical protein